MRFETLLSIVFQLVTGLMAVEVDARKRRVLSTAKTRLIRELGCKEQS